MKKLMMIIGLTASAVGLFAAPAQQLVATAELASFAEITPTVMALGQMMNNPLLPTLALGGAQQALAQQYGRLRNDGALVWQVYLDPEALAKADFKDKDPFKGKGAVAFVYPTTETEATLLQKPGATKDAAGVIRLPKGKSATWAKFTADGKFCVFADTAAVAVQAAEDFARRPAKAAGAKAHLLRVDVPEAGVAALLPLIERAQAEQQKNLLSLNEKGPLMTKVAAYNAVQQAEQQKVLKTFSSATFALDLDDNGISVGGIVRRTPGTVDPAAGVPLPAGALDFMPMGATLLGAYTRLSSLSGSCQDEAGYSRLIACTHELLRGVAPAIDAEAAKNKDLAKWSALIKDVVAAADEALNAAAYPAKGDWDALALGFDPAKRPALLGGGQAKTEARENAAAVKFLNRLATAFARQWPGKALLVKTAENAFVLDWGVLLDVVAAQTGTDKKPKEMKELAKFKQTLAGILGGMTTEISFAGAQRCAVASPGVKLASQAGGEGRFAAAIPEAAKVRPAGAFYFTPYAFARDIVLPLVAKYGDKETAQTMTAMQQALPPASEKGALAGAVWVRRDSAIRFILRLTGDEVKSIGAAVGAVSGAAAGDDDDDDDE